MSSLGVPSSHVVPFRPSDPQDQPPAPGIPLLTRTDHDEPSVFLPGAMLQEARRQKNLLEGAVPEVCVLDPDGDLVDHVRTVHSARRCGFWACFHTELWEWETDGQRFGIVGRAVGAPFAVLIAEQLFVSGCKLLVSIASAGEIAPGLTKPSFMLIERALRDEGTSYHYLPAEPFVTADAALLLVAADAAASLDLPVGRGTSWTTDAPFRETAASIAERRAQGIHTVEMESAALLAFAKAKAADVVCIAHITNAMGQGEGDFAKGEDCGAKAALLLVSELARRRL